MATHLHRSFLVLLLLAAGRLEAQALKRYLVIVEYYANWFQASNFCRRLGMDLAEVSSNTEQVVIAKELRKYETSSWGADYLVDVKPSGGVWLSASDLGKNGSFVWSATGRPVAAYSNWATDEPRKARNGEHCVHMFGAGKWRNEQCSKQKYFVCQYF